MSNDPHGDENTLIQVPAGPYELGDGSIDPDWVITGYLILKLRTEDSSKGNG